MCFNLNSFILDSWGLKRLLSAFLLWSALSLSQAIEAHSTDDTCFQALLKASLAKLQTHVPGYEGDEFLILGEGGNTRALLPVNWIHHPEAYYLRVYFRTRHRNMYLNDSFLFQIFYQMQQEGQNLGFQIPWVRAGKDERTQEVQWLRTQPLTKVLLDPNRPREETWALAEAYNMNFDRFLERIQSRFPKNIISVIAPRVLHIKGCPLELKNAISKEDLPLSEKVNNGFFFLGVDNVGVQWKSNALVLIDPE